MKERESSLFAAAWYSEYSSIEIDVSVYPNDELTAVGLAFPHVPRTRAFFFWTFRLSSSNAGMLIETKADGLNGGIDKMFMLAAKANRKTMQVV
ncbi:hypothetical protein SAMN06265222_10798 [Neorhodopirellula lusitana]|uniref:Uncharacterized protein n=1 Tax=Neorhodopirellula lusitana TaxID=445327 RepID=A0ABY1QAW3_9BACT|nr:hypothetical protein [Neorhodopirellula lusitana]SMP61445.1 hypothetical protein SAMN06265222_10798 [Neorhodopirellula lusitana]